MAMASWKTLGCELAWRTMWRSCRDTYRRMDSWASAPHWPPLKRFCWMSSRTGNQAQHDSSLTVAPLEQVARLVFTTAARHRG